jgi:hypothetical protein
MATYKKSEYLLSGMLGLGSGSDNLRKEIGSIWIRQNDNKFKLQTSSLAPAGKFTSVTLGDVTINQEYESAPYYSLTQSVAVSSDAEAFKNYSDFANFINGSGSTPPAIATESPFFDATIKLSLPYSQQELKLIENSARPLSYMANPVYNFYQRNYENKITTTPEQILPNLYSVYGSREEIGLSPNALNDYDSELVNLGNLFANIVGNTEPAPQEVEILPIKNTQFLKEANAYKRIFPMYNEVEFSTDTNTVLAETMEDNDLSTSFLKFLNSNQSGSFSIDGFKENLSIDAEGEVVFVVSPTTGIFQTYDAFDWIKQVASEVATPNDEEVSFIGPPPEEVNKFFKFFNFLKFEAKIQKMIKKYLRSYSDVLNGIPSYSETVAYKVEKRKAGQIITTYLFPNSNEIEVYKFVDTQVKYGEKYDYTAYAYQLFFGAEYMYKDLVLKQTQQQQNVSPLTVLNPPDEDQRPEGGDFGTGTGGGDGVTPGGSRPAGFGGFKIDEEFGKIKPEDEGTDTEGIDGFGEEFGKESE